MDVEAGRAVGYIYIDDWSATGAMDGSGLGYWLKGLPVVGFGSESPQSPQARSARRRKA